jgi:hypothetical protein
VPAEADLSWFFGERERERIEREERKKREKKERA